MNQPQIINIQAQRGPQSQLLECFADFAIFGGSAGGGKSFGLLLDPLRFYNIGNFSGGLFRKNLTQIKNKGGLWDESRKLYQQLGARPNRSALEWNYHKNKNEIWSLKMGHLEYEDTVYDHQGAQYDWLGLDEGTHFSEDQAFYMLSRLRSVSGIKPYARLTCNPDYDSWIRRFIDWWVGPDGFIIPERSGKIRWFVRRDVEFIWSDNKEYLDKMFGPNEALSFTFIRSSLEDNKILLEKDPRYVAKLNAQNKVERERLLHGNWNVRYSSGSMFREEWFPIIDAIPGGWIKQVRFWDRAASPLTLENKDPDWTRGLKLYQYPDGTFVVADLKSMRDSPGKVADLIKNVASHDGWHCEIVSQQDPGSAGVLEKDHFIRMLAGYVCSTHITSKNKVDRAKSVSAQVEAGNVRVLRAPWNQEFFAELEAFPEGSHDDIVDVLSGAFNHLFNSLTIFDAK